MSCLIITVWRWSKPYMACWNPEPMGTNNTYVYTYVTYAPKKLRSHSPSICSDNHLSRTSLSIPAPKRWHGAHVAVAATGKIDLQTSESPVASETTAFMMNRRTSRKKVDLFAWAWRHATLVIKWNRRSSQKKPLHLKVLAFLNCSLSLSNCSLSLFYLSRWSFVWSFFRVALPNLAVQVAQVPPWRLLLFVVPAHQGPKALLQSDSRIVSSNPSVKKLLGNPPNHGS